MEGNGDSIDCWRRELMSSPNGHFPCFVEDASGTHDCVGGRSIADRRAAKFGFDASKISTSAFNSSSSSASPAAKSPYLLRTPGISPSALLESPMMLPNLQPSPTTGAFGLRRVGSESGTINATSSIADKDKDIDDSSSFTFDPHCKPVSLPCYSAVQNRHPHRSSAPSSEVEVEFQHPTVTHPPRNADFEFPTQLQAEVTVDNSEFNSLPDCKVSNDMTVKANSTDCQSSDSHAAAPAAIEMQQVEYHRGEDTGKENSDGDRNIQDPSGRGTSEDGYTWRKYGQKQVKGSEFPRSYYQCTHPSCPVKKKVEHSHDGQISEIVYKGAHNHPQPQPCRRSTFGEPLRAGDRGGSVQGGGDTVWGDSHHGCDDLKLGSEWRPDGLERKCSTSIAARISDAPPANQGKLVSALESAGTPKISSTIASNEDDDEDAAARGSIVAADDHDNEPDLKKQRMEEPLIETALASRAIREPRVIVQIESEVDILDDGYRWRKYGQKVVKGNPNPRSYYKCTHPGCTVRKHVERASHNLKCVLTTYEGKHNHDLPAARNSSHTSSAGGNSAPSSSNPQGLPTQPQNHHLPKSEPQNLAHANRSQDFLRPNFLGNFAGGGASIYQMKFPTLPSTMHYGAFQTTALMVPAAPGLSTSPSLGFPPPSNLYAPNDSQGRAVGMLQPSFLGQQSKEGDKLIRPMQD